MIAEILCVGTEVLIGDIVNTNAAYISKVLSGFGIDVLYHSVCGDNASRLESCLSIALSRCDIVVTTGGLGPTYDDITKNVVCKVLGLELYQNEDVVKELSEYFARTNRIMTDNNLSQALVPMGAEVLKNCCGTAPGLFIEKDKKIVIMMPGPPREMKPMLGNEVLPHLKKYTDKVLVSSNVNIFGMGESSVDTALRELMESSSNPTLAPYIDDGEVRIRVTASGHNEQSAKALIAPMVAKIKEKLGSVVYGVDSDGLQYELVNILAQKQLTVSTAESCTGGLVSQLITSVSGSSKVFGFGFCTYADQAKMALLGVNKITLESFGAVSVQTACEMAIGAKKASGADIAVSLTGIAGPTGGSADKPVGLVYMGVAVKDKVYAKKLLLAQHKSPDRDFIRKLASKNALKVLIDEAYEF